MVQEVAEQHPGKLWFQDEGRFGQQGILTRKSHFLSNRAYADYDDLLDAGGEGYRSLTPELLKSICATSWLTPENEA